MSGKKDDRPDRPSVVKEAHDYRDRCAASNSQEDHFIPPRLWPYLDPPIVRGPPLTSGQGTSSPAASTQPRDQDQGSAEIQSSVQTQEHLAPPRNTLPKLNKPLVPQPSSQQGNNLKQQAGGALISLLRSQGHSPALSAHTDTMTPVGQQSMGHPKYIGPQHGKASGKRPRQSYSLTDSDSPLSPALNHLGPLRKDKKNLAPNVSTTSQASTLGQFTPDRQDANDHVLANSNPRGTKSSGGSSENRPDKKRQKLTESGFEMEGVEGPAARTEDAKEVDGKEWTEARRVEAARKAKDVEKVKVEQAEDANSPGMLHNKGSDIGHNSRPLPGTFQSRDSTQTVPSGANYTMVSSNPSRQEDVGSTSQFPNGRGASSALPEQFSTRVLGHSMRPIEPRPAGVDLLLGGPGDTLSSNNPVFRYFRHPVGYVPENPFHSINQFNQSRNQSNLAINPHGPASNLDTIARKLSQGIMELARSVPDLERALANQARNQPSQATGLPNVTRNQLVQTRSPPNGYKSPYSPLIQAPPGYRLSDHYNHDQVHRLIAQLVADPGIDNDALWRVIGESVGSISGQAPSNRNLITAGNALSISSNVPNPTLLNNQSRGFTGIGQTFGGRGPAGSSNAQNPAQPNIPGEGDSVPATGQTPGDPVPTVSASQAMSPNVQNPSAPQQNLDRVGARATGLQGSALGVPLPNYFSWDAAAQNSRGRGGRVMTAGQTLQARQACSDRRNQPIAQNPAPSTVRFRGRVTRRRGRPRRGNRPSRGNTQVDPLSVSSDSEKEAEGPKE